MDRTTRKRLAAGRSMAENGLRNGLIAGAVILVGILLFGFGRNAYLLFAKPDRDGALLWSTTDGVGYSEKGGEKTRVYRLATRGSEAIKSPKFCVRNGALVYYSPDDRSICILEPNQNERWIDVGQALGDGYVLDIRPSKSGVILNTFAKATYDVELPEPKLALEVDFGSGQASELGLKEVVADVKNGKMVSRSGKSFSSSGGTGFKDTPRQIASWDFDFSNGTLVVDEGRAAHAISSKDKKVFGLGMIYHMRTVRASRPGEIWVQAVKPLNAGFMLVNFDANGSFKKLQLKDEKPINPPYVKATPELLSLLDTVSRKVPE